MQFDCKNLKELESHLIAMGFQAYSLREGLDFLVRKIYAIGSDIFDTEPTFYKFEWRNNDGAEVVAEIALVGQEREDDSWLTWYVLQTA